MCLLFIKSKGVGKILGKGVRSGDKKGRQMKESLLKSLSPLVFGVIYLQDYTCEFGHNVCPSVQLNTLTSERESTGSLTDRYSHTNMLAKCA